VSTSPRVAGHRPFSAPSRLPSAGTTPLPTPARASLAPPAPAGTPQGSRLPLRADTGNATQVVTVVARSAASTTATLQAWDRTGAGWVRHGPASRAYLGDKGMTTRPDESLSATPIGSLTLTQTFGRAERPGHPTALLQDGQQRLVSHRRGVEVLQHSLPVRRLLPVRHRAGGEPLPGRFPLHVRRGDRLQPVAVTRGAGSAFFLHVTEFRPTTGCVSIPRGSLVSIMRWLSPAAHPRIVMGVAESLPDEPRSRSRGRSPYSPVKQTLCSSRSPGMLEKPSAVARCLENLP
jgi:hypothetical protein